MAGTGKQIIANYIHHGVFVMKPEIYAAIQLEWCKISNEEHRSLIYDYVTMTNEGVEEGWMEFLRHHFQIDDNSVQHLALQSGYGDELTSAA